MKFLTISMLLVTARAFCMENKGRIVNGHDGSNTQFPYMVAIESNPSEDTLFGGTLIANNWVVTAAHCAFIGDFFHVYLGAADLDDFQIGYTVTRSEITVHPEFDINTGRNDIALIEIPYTQSCDYVSPIHIPRITSIYPTYKNKYGILAGWGRRGDEIGNSARLQWARMPIADKNNCEGWIGFNPIEQICVHISDGPIPGRGDSGGPLVLETTGQLIGVLSYRFRTNFGNGAPIVFTRIVYHLKWIQKVTGVSYAKN